MKQRYGFISNSSSMSFIVFGTNNDEWLTEIPEYLIKCKPVAWDKTLKDWSITVPDKKSNMEFGWQFKRYYEFGAKLNYALAQALGVKGNLSYDYKEMIRKVLEKYIPDQAYLHLLIDYNYFHWDSIKSRQCSIDHQSAYYEYREPYHYIFRSEELLERFLFNTGSYIQCGNDNEEAPNEQWEESYQRFQDWAETQGLSI